MSSLARKATVAPRFKLKWLIFAAIIAVTCLILAGPLRLAQRFPSLLSSVRSGHINGKPYAKLPERRPLMSATMVPDAYRNPPQLPPTFAATPESLVERTKQLIQASRELQDKIVAQVTPEKATFDNVLLPLVHDENTMSDETNVICFYQAVSTDKALRDASTQAENLFNEFDIESSTREDVFRLVEATLARKDAALDAESQRLLEKTHRGFIQYGLAIPAGAQRERFKAIKKRLSQIATAFQKNLNEETGGLWFALDELEGVPVDVLAGLKHGAAGSEHEGKVWLTFKYPDIFPTLRHAVSADVRRRLFVANENKCPENVPLFREAVVLRDEAARLLGYPNHATLRIEDKMAKTPRTVDDFLGDLRTRLAPGAQREREKLMELKKQDLELRSEGDKYDGHYFLWDHRFYDRLMIEKNFSIDQQKIAEYFSLQSTVEGMLHIFEQLFGLKFVEITPGKERDKLAKSSKGTDIVWHEDVTLFSVWDDEGEGSGFVGYLYLDLFPRDGKYGHAANFNLQPGYITTNGTRHYPATSLVCNFSKPTPKKPSLLKHDEVVTLFHELGHGIHDLVSRTKYARFHGTSTVRDFVEAPSQMLEHWCWDRTQLKVLGRHYSYLSKDYEDAWRESVAAAATAAAAAGTDDKGSSGPAERPPEKLPDALVDSLIRTKHVNDAMANMRQLHFGIYDMTVHEPASHADAEALQLTELYNNLRKEITQLDGPEVFGAKPDWAHGQSTFAHLVGGYDAGYYGYLSSQVYSADMFFSRFAANPMNGEVGRRYRHTVLERGGSQDEMKSLEEFLGRKPNTEAFYRELGLSK